MMLQGGASYAVLVLDDELERRIAAAAQAWLVGHPEHASAEIRFDAVLVMPRRWPRHIVAAFDATP